MNKGKTIDQIEVGNTASFQKTISETDVYLFAGITGDYNPAHLNDIEAKNTIFGERVAHGLLSAGLISAVLGVQLPGPGTIYLGQNLNFLKPVKFGDTITAIVEVIEKIESKNIIKLRTTCVNQNYEEVIIGIATVMPRKKV
ncbi:MaoC family dehydratase [Proteocatella sphenisci]|uniref:MaoC family dehydratase n=1 Tax=Proteocatella sphenisci TaxID=181070 RepID=UPI00048D3241|nr:MaoC family dehydratase [Proteocatella sphenisci]